MGGNPVCKDKRPERVGGGGGAVPLQGSPPSLYRRLHGREQIYARVGDLKGLGTIPRDYLLGHTQQIGPPRLPGDPVNREALPAAQLPLTDSELEECPLPRDMPLSGYPGTTRRNKT